MVFLNTTGDVLNATQQTAFESYIRAGGGYVGVHAAADTEYDWPFYGSLVGAYFASHPAIQQATVKVEDRAHRGHRPPAADLEPHRRVVQLPHQPRVHRARPGHPRRVVVLRRHDGRATTRIAWCKTYGGGRSFYTGGGHTQESYADPAFRAHLLGGIRYAAGQRQGRLPPGDRLHARSTTARPAGWSQAGPGSFTNADATLHLDRRHGPATGTSAKQFTNYSLKLDWKLAGDDNSGVFVGFPAVRRPLVRGEQRLRDPDRRHRRARPHHRARSTPSSRPTSRPATRRCNPPGQWNTYEILVEGERLQVFLNGVKINDFTNTDPVRAARRPHRHPEPRRRRRRRRSATSGSRSWAGTPPAGNTTVQAEAFSSASGVTPFTKAGANGGQTLGYIDPGDWAGVPRAST